VETVEKCLMDVRDIAFEGIELGQDKARDNDYGGEERRIAFEAKSKDVADAVKGIIENGGIPIGGGAVVRVEPIFQGGGIVGGRIVIKFPF
jgi:sugar phosphate isomerase/epimerase